jgi:Tfp pilus assembly protein PilN
VKSTINILPASFRRQLVLRNRCVQWTAIIAVVLVGGWGWHRIEMREHSQLSRRLDALSREHAPTQTMLKQVVDMRQRLKDLEQQEAVAKELETQRNTLTLLGVISNAAQKTKGRLRVTKMDLKDFQNVRPVANAGAAPAPGGLVLSGVSLDNPAVAELLDGLQHSGIFSNVELLKLKEREDKSVSLRDYEVRCEF